MRGRNVRILDRFREELIELRGAGAVNPRTYASWTATEWS
jgi:hypothetical protein